MLQTSKYGKSKNVVHDNLIILTHEFVLCYHVNNNNYYAMQYS